jgi:hypothetical protein
MFTIIVLSFSQPPTVFCHPCLYHWAIDLTPSPLFLISIIYLSVLQGCCKGPYLPHLNLNPLLGLFLGICCSLKLTPLYPARWVLIPSLKLQWNLSSTFLIVVKLAWCCFINSFFNCSFNYSHYCKNFYNFFFLIYFLQFSFIWFIVSLSIVFCRITLRFFFEVTTWLYK